VIKEFRIVVDLVLLKAVPQYLSIQSLLPGLVISVRLICAQAGNVCRMWHQFQVEVPRCLLMASRWQELVMALLAVLLWPLAVQLCLQDKQ
jgi:hypothetical protein